MSRIVELAAPHEDRRGRAPHPDKWATARRRVSNKWGVRSVYSAGPGVCSPFCVRAQGIHISWCAKHAEKGVFWPGKRAVSAWRQACAERTHFCEGVVEKLGDLETSSSTRPSRMYRQQALCRVCCAEVAPSRPSGGRFMGQMFVPGALGPAWRRGVGKTFILGWHSGRRGKAAPALGSTGAASSLLRNTIVKVQFSTE